MGNLSELFGRAKKKPDLPENISSYATPPPLQVKLKQILMTPGSGWKFQKRKPHLANEPWKTKIELYFPY